MSGVVVVNDPKYLSLVTHKAFLSSLSDVPTPLTLISRDPLACTNFAQGKESGVVVKPVRGSGGAQVSFVRAGDRVGLAKAVEAVRKIGDGYAVGDVLNIDAAKLGTSSTARKITLVAEDLTAGTVTSITITKSFNVNFFAFNAPEMNW
jgi:hypothetical protein